MLISETGTYRGVLNEHAVNLSTNGCPQFVAKLQAMEKYDYDAGEWQDYTSREDVEITAFLTLFTKEQKPIFHVDSIKTVFEWDGKSLAALDQADLSGAAVQFNVDEHTYKDETRLQVAGIKGFDDTPGTGVGVKKLDAGALSALDAAFSAGLQKTTDAPKPVSAKTAAAAKPKATKPKATAKPAPAPEPVIEEPAEETAEPEADEPCMAAPAIPLAPPTAPKAPAKPKAEPAAGMTKDEAWSSAYEMKAQTVTDEQLGKAWLAAIHKIAGDIDEDAITTTQWQAVYENVVAEYGVF